jgi:glycosyltransferase involved in cell wall biosynthesis
MTSPRHGLRVLKVLHGSPPDAMGGAGLVAGTLAVALKELGCDVVMAHAGARGPTAWRGVPVRSLDLSRPLGFAGSWQTDPTPIRRLLQELDPHVVHIHHLGGWPLALPQLARAHGARVVLTLHDYAIVCARGQAVNLHSEVCDGPSGRACTTCLQPYLGLRARLTGWPTSTDKAMVRQRLEAAVDALNSAHVRLSPSLDLARRIERWGVGAVQVHPIPLPSPVLPVPPVPRGPVRFLFCGSVIPTKGAHLLVDAFARWASPDARLTVAGPTPPFPADPGYAKRLQRTAESTPGVEWRGEVAHPHIPSLLTEHDVLVVPSVWPENSPLIVREATAAGLRVVVPAIGGTRELAPQARVVQTLGPGAEDRLLEALVAESQLGHARRASQHWPSPLDCARSLLRSAYTTESRAAVARTD